MPRAKNAPSAPNSPAAVAFSARLAATLGPLGLEDARAAEFLGVPVPTFRKWRAGTRAPSAAAVRLIDVFDIVRTFAPGLFEGMVPKSVATSDKERVSQKRPGTPARRKSVASPDKAGVTQS